MFRCFETDRAIQAAAVLLRAHPGHQMSYLRLLKLLYIADRESIRTTARPIVGVHYAALDYGPLHSEILDLIRGEHPAEPHWSRHIEKDGYLVRLVADPGVLELSKHDVRTLHEAAERWRSVDDWQLVNETHNFPEWRSNHVAGSSRPIRFEDLLRSLDFTDEERRTILAEAEDEAQAETFRSGAAADAP